MSADRIALKGLRAHGRHGVLEAERELGQQFVIDATLFLDTAPAAAADDLTKTVHYGELAQALVKVVEGQRDVIGYAFAINGHINSADVYASSELFKKLWPKLLKANAIEAIAELQQDKFKPASSDSVRGFLTEAEKAKGSDKDVNARVNLMTREDDENIMFETRDRKQDGAWIHRNYIKKK